MAKRVATGVIGVGRQAVQAALNAVNVPGRAGPGSCSFVPEITVMPARQGIQAAQTFRGISQPLLAQSPVLRSN